MDISKTYSVRASTQEDIPHINTLLEKSFHPEETILQCLMLKYHHNIDEDDFNQMTEDQRIIIGIMVSNYPCLVVVHKPSNKLVGVIVTILSENPALVPELNRSIDVYNIYQPKSKVLCDYFVYMNGMIEHADLFSKYPGAVRLMEFYAIAIDKEHRKKGLSTLLLIEGINLASKHDVDLTFGLFTSPFSKRAAEKVGMKNVKELDLPLCLDLQFSELNGHNTAFVMVKEIEK